MAQVINGTQKEFKSALKAEIEKTLTAYNEMIELRRKTLDQDLEQIRVYYDIIDKQAEAKLNPFIARRINKLLSKKLKKVKENNTCQEKQDELEERFLRLQEALVSLISKQFTYR